MFPNVSRTILLRKILKISQVDVYKRRTPDEAKKAIIETAEIHGYDPYLLLRILPQYSRVSLLSHLETMTKKRHQVDQTKKYLRFTKDEDKLLLEGFSEFKNDQNIWFSIHNKYLPNRTPETLRLRYHHATKPYSNKKWTEEEDAKLIELVQKNGKRWSFFVSTHFHTRSWISLWARWDKVITCRQMRANHPYDWTEKEHKILLDANEKLGNSWKQIQTQFLPHRHTSDILARAMKLKKSRLKKSAFEIWSKILIAWRANDQEELLSLMKLHGVTEKFLLNKIKLLNDIGFELENDDVDVLSTCLIATGKNGIRHVNIFDLEKLIIFQRTGVDPKNFKSSEKIPWSRWANIIAACGDIYTNNERKLAKHSLSMYLMQNRSLLDAVKEGKKFYEYMS
ncbi:hypothetical protein HK096_005600 [Nowakowskiella sp. JEL0078]|nr:hypothetical protein HK096_005600 [Nowakowskiella sp. JEL0078]